MSGLKLINVEPYAILVSLEEMSLHGLVESFSDACNRYLKLSASVAVQHRTIFDN
jgi:hypothetical protein